MNHFYRKKQVMVLLSLLSVPLSCTESEGQKDGQSAELRQGENEKVIHYARSADPKTLDPVGQFDQASGSILVNLYDTLFEYSYLKRPYELAPSLLSSMPVVSEDKLTYTFDLRKGVTFQDDVCFKNGVGRELVADDVLYSLKRFADANLNVRSWFLLDGVVEGLDDFRELSKKAGPKKVDHRSTEVTGLVKVSKYQFKIKIKRKNPLFLYSLATSSTAIVPHEAVKHYLQGFKRHPVGTGPFRLVEFRKKQTLTLKKNKKYFNTYPIDASANFSPNLLIDAGKKIPIVDEVKIHYIPEPQPQMLKFKKGELDWVGLDRDNFVKMAYKDASGELKLKPNEAKKYTLYTESGLSSYFYYFNMKDPLIGSNKQLRQAIVLAIDVNKKIDLLKNGRGLKLNTVVPHQIKGSEKDIGSYWYEYDLERAKKIMAASGLLKDGPFEITLTMSGSTSGHKKDFEFMRNSLSAIDIHLIPDYKTWSSHTKTIAKGDYQISTWAWGADYPDAENFYQLFYSKNIGSSNYNFFSDKRYDQLYEEIRFMENSVERYEKIKEMMKILQDEVPFILDSTPLMSGLVQKNIRNFKRSMMADLPFKFIRI